MRDVIIEDYKPQQIQCSRCYTRFTPDREDLRWMPEYGDWGDTTVSQCPNCQHWEHVSASTYLTKSLPRLKKPLGNFLVEDCLPWALLAIIPIVTLAIILFG